MSERQTKHIDVDVWLLLILFGVDKLPITWLQSVRIVQELQSKLKRLQLLIVKWLSCRFLFFFLAPKTYSLPYISLQYHKGLFLFRIIILPLSRCVWSWYWLNVVRHVASCWYVFSHNHPLSVGWPWKKRKAGSLPSNNNSNQNVYASLSDDDHHNIFLGDYLLAKIIVNIIITVTLCLSLDDN